MRPIRFVFLMASERSGSNLITTFLDANPGICAPSPVHLVRTLLECRHIYGSLENNESWHAFIQDCRGLVAAYSAREDNSAGVDSLIPLPPQRNLAGVVESFYRQQAEAKKARVVFVKENQTHLLVPFIEKAFPGSRYIWLVRDPRDMAASHVTSPGRSGGVAEASRRWLTEQKATRMALNAMSDQEPDRDVYMRVRYEDLVMHPEQTAMRLCGFMDVPYTQSMMDFYTQDQAVARAQTSVYWKNVKKPMIASKAGRFVNDLEPDEIRYVEARCGQEMLSFGYKPHYPATPPDSLSDFGSVVHERSTPAQGIPQEERARRQRIKAVRMRMERRDKKKRGKNVSHPA